MRKTCIFYVCPLCGLDRTTGKMMGTEWIDGVTEVIDNNAPCGFDRDGHTFEECFDAKFGGAMKLIYIAGPFNGDDKVHDVHANINVASKIALECWKKGWAVICPHKNTAGFQHYHDMPHELWMAGDIEMISRCDAVLMVPDWLRSPGACEEFDFAMSKHIPVFCYSDGVPSPNNVGRGILWRASNNPFDWPRKL
jgi:hypothetical protein